MIRLPVLLGVAVLSAAWFGPLPHLVPHSFSAHMILHMAVVGIGVPLLAIGMAPWISGHGWLRSQIALPIVASLIDLVVVWGWHAEGPHNASRASPLILALEQASFAVAAFLVWVVAYGVSDGRHQESALSGAMTLFFTSMHMTLLGALIALAPRPLYAHAGHAHALSDQQLGGAIMLTIGAVVYLGGALILFARVLRRGTPA